MHELTLTDMDQVSGGIVPLIAIFLVQAASMAVRHAAASAFLGGVGLGWSAADVYNDLEQNPRGNPITGR